VEGLESELQNSFIDWTEPSLKEITAIFDRVAERTGASRTHVFSFARWALTGREEGLQIPFVVKLLGKERCLTRLQNAHQKLIQLNVR
jgi:glutamyl/glutaminyl-tRNA synthetase